MNKKRKMMRLDKAKILTVALILTLCSIYLLGCVNVEETGHRKSEEQEIIKQDDLQGFWSRDDWTLYNSFNFSNGEVVIGNHIDTIYRFKYQVNENIITLIHDNSIVRELEVIFQDKQKMIIKGIPNEEEAITYTYLEDKKPRREIVIYEDIISYQINPKSQKIRFYSKDEDGNNFENHGRLKLWLASQDEELVFAMNGGMYKKNLSPQGLYIEDEHKIVDIDTLSDGYGNFYLHPNGIFLITNENKAQILPTDLYINDEGVKYATQSGPMLTINGEIHSAFNENSQNLHIRNGVGVLPNGDLLFAISKRKVNFYRFAKFFQDNKCKNALYLDGFVSKLYLPMEDWIEEEGQFGIIIAEIK